MSTRPSIERNKKYVQEHVSDKIKCEHCQHIVDAVWHDGIVSLAPAPHDCVVQYKTVLTPDVQEGTLFDIETL